ncbi:MAG: hypothetical protein E3J30_11950 [Anaerolineales bacterium]|nr:MAG: hypothetical protein E3J30_11950 [Anaerolineales bacterium]
MDDTPSHNRFFIYPQVQKHDEIHTVLACMEAFRQSLGETDRDLVGILISYADAHSSQSHLLPHLTPFEFVLFAMLIEQQRELANQKKTSHETSREFTHPPFP